MSTALLQNTASELQQRRARLSAAERRWLRLYESAATEGSIFTALAIASAAAAIPMRSAQWYSDNLRTLDSNVARLGLDDLNSAAQFELVRTQRRLAAYAGRYTVTYPHEPRTARKNSPLCIGIDIRCLAIPSTRKRGIGRYVLNTVGRMIRMGSQHRFVLLNEPGLTPDDELQTVFKSINVTFRALTEDCDKDLDVFLLTDPCPMLAGRRIASLPVRNCPWLSIVYDFIPLEFPELYLRGNTHLVDEYLENVEMLAQRAVHFFPISDYVGQQCARILGAPKEIITPIYGGVDDFFFQTAPQSGYAADGNYFLYVGGADARKNIGRLIESFNAALPNLPSDCKLLFAGELDERKVADILHKSRLDHLRNRLHGLGGVTDDRLRELYNGALATVFVSLSEGLGLPALEAMAAGCPVISSNNSALGETVGDAGILVDPSSTSEIAKAMVSLSQSADLRLEFKQRGIERAQAWKWETVASGILAVLPMHATKTAKAHNRPRKLRVAMLNRANVWDAPGGDSKIMLQMQRAAAEENIEIFFPNTDTQVASADIVHAVNMTLPALLRNAADVSERNAKPLVVTTLFEDWPLYLNASHQAFAAYHAVLTKQLPRHALDIALLRAGQGTPAPAADGSGLLQAAKLLACADSEAERLAVHFPQLADRIAIVPFEVELPLPAEQKTIDSLCEALGFEEYVLCIGRLETRKNQLALLAALEDSDIPIVFAAGDYTPQPQYAQAVRAWRRKGPVKILDRMPWYLLSAVIRGAAVHALPSFYELPGLVHLECVAAGTPIVAADWGSLHDYLPTGGFHVCDPLDLASIRSAVQSALTARPSQCAQNSAREFTPSRLGQTLAAAYDSAITDYSHTLSRGMRTTRRFHAPTVSGGYHVAV